MNKEVEPSFSFSGQPAAMAFFSVHLLERMEEGEGEGEGGEEEEEEERTCMQGKNCDGN